MVDAVLLLQGGDGLVGAKDAALPDLREGLGLPLVLVALAGLFEAVQDLAVRFAQIYLLL